MIIVSEAMSRKTDRSYLGPVKLPSSGRSEPKERSQRISEKYPNCFPGSVKHSLIPEEHLIFFALCCVQRSLELRPQVEPLFDDIVDRLGTPSCQKLASIGEKDDELARKVGKFMVLRIQRKWYAHLVLVPPFLLIAPRFVFRPEIWTLARRIWKYIRQAFNRDPAKPRAKGSLMLFLAVLFFAKFCHMRIGPYEWDRQKRPLSAEVALVRPKTVEGRATKRKYDNAMKQFEKHTDKYYLNAARKWLLARVICNSVAEAESKLNLDPGQLHKELYKEPWDDVMGYQKG